MIEDLERTLTEYGLVCRVGGEIAYTTQGKQFKSEVEDIARNRLTSIQAEEVELPTLVDYSKLKLDRRISIVRHFFCFRTSSRDKTGFLLTRTGEELAADYFFQTKTEGIIYQIRTKFRDENGEELDFLKRREFTMLDVYSFDSNSSEAQKTYQRMKRCFADILSDLEIPYSTKISGDVCSGVQSEEFICEDDRMRGVELGHIYQLGNLYTKQYNLENVMMGSYVFGIDRLFAAISIIGGGK